MTTRIPLVSLGSGIPGLAFNGTASPGPVYEGPGISDWLAAALRASPEEQMRLAGERASNIGKSLIGAPKYVLAAKLGQAAELASGYIADDATPDLQDVLARLGLATGLRPQP